MAGTQPQNPLFPGTAPQVPGAPKPGTPRPGYTYDPVQGRWVTTVGSAPNQLEEQTRARGFEDTAAQQRAAAIGQEQARYTSETGYNRGQTSLDRSRQNTSDALAFQEAERQKQLQNTRTGAPSAPSIDALAQEQFQQGQQNNNRDYMAQQTQQGLENNFAIQDRLRRNALQDQLMGMFKSIDTSGGGSPQPFTPTPYTPPPSIPYTGAPDTNAEMQAANASENSAFAQAKAKAGQMGRASLQSLRGDLAERGILKSGTEARGLVSNLQAVDDPLAAQNAAAQQEQVGIAEHGADRAQHAADTRYQGQQAEASRNQAAMESQRNYEASTQKQMFDEQQQRRQQQLELLMKSLGNF